MADIAIYNANITICNANIILCLYGPPVHQGDIIPAHKCDIINHLIK